MNRYLDPERPQLQAQDTLWPGYPPATNVEPGDRRGKLHLLGRMTRRMAAPALLIGLAAVVLALAPAQNAYDAPLRLARELLQGRTYLPGRVPWLEMYTRDGRAYIAYPPMVSFVVVPFAFLAGGTATQPLFNSLLIAYSAILLFRFVQGIGGLKSFAQVAALIYVLGTSVLHSAANGNVWLLMHSEGNFFFLLALCLALNRGTFFWAGLCFMIAAQCRYVIGFGGLVFPLIASLEARPPGRPRAVLHASLYFILGALPPLLAVMAFQWWTVGSPLASPYVAGWEQWQPRDADFSLAFVQSNLRFYLFSLPTFLDYFPFVRFDATGQSIWLLSPILLGVFLVNWRVRLTRALLPGALAMFVFYLLYRFNGTAQYGSRYMQDLLPLLIPLSLAGFARGGRGWRTLRAALVAASVAINAYGAFVMRAFPQ